MNITDDGEEREGMEALDYKSFLKDYIKQMDYAVAHKATFTTPSRSILDSSDKSELMKKLFDMVQEARITESMTEFTSNYNRAAYNDYGVKAAEQVKGWMDDLARAYNKTEDSFTSYFVPTVARGYQQPSVVAVLGKNLPGEPLVISAHLDTLGQSRMPGADDDGSGSMVVLEAARVILESKQEFNRPIYFIWYAAEEMGLIGSKQVVNTMKNKNVKVDSVLHFDTVGRRANPKDPTLWFLLDFVNKDFTKYLADLVKTHLSLPVNFTTCEYACSDHASWTLAGFVAGAAAESDFIDINPNLHTADDDATHVNFENLVNFTKLALAYVVDKAVDTEIAD